MLVCILRLCFFFKSVKSYIYLQQGRSIVKLKKMFYLFTNVKKYAKFHYTEGFTHYKSTPMSLQVVKLILNCMC